MAVSGRRVLAGRLRKYPPVRLLGRVRSDRVMRAPAGRRKGPRPGRKPRHDKEFRLADPAAHLRSPQRADRWV